MKHLALTLALGPLFFLQGQYVRRITPTLPEPPGERQGTFGSGSPLRLLILGDSAAAGVGAETQEQALSGQLVSQLGAHFTVSWTLLARTGDTTTDALRHLDCVERKPFDVVVTSLGVNDLTNGHQRWQWLRHQTRLIAKLRNEFAARLILISGLPPMHLFPSLPQPLRWFMGRGARHFNAGLHALTQSIEGCQLVSVDLSRQPELLTRSDSIASDGFHPGPAFYTTWAKHLAERILNAPFHTS